MRSGGVSNLYSLQCKLKLRKKYNSSSLNLNKVKVQAPDLMPFHNPYCLFSQGYPCPYGYNPADFLIKSLAVTTNDELSSRRRLKRICDEFSVCDFAKEVDLEINYQTHVGTYDVSFEIPSRIVMNVNE